MWKRIIAIFLVLLLAAAVYLFWPESATLEDLTTSGAAYNARILRDERGVPHTFGETDADVAYGLAQAFVDTLNTVKRAHGQVALPWSGEV